MQDTFTGGYTKAIIDIHDTLENLSANGIRVNKKFVMRLLEILMADQYIRQEFRETGGKYIVFKVSPKGELIDVKKSKDQP